MYYKTVWHLFSTIKKLLDSKNVFNEDIEKDLTYFCDVCFNADQLKTYNTSLSSQFYFEIKQVVNEDKEINMKDIYEASVKACEERESPTIFEIAPHNLSIELTDSKVIKRLKKIVGKSGIYYLYNGHKELIYIGKSFNLSSRIIQSYASKKAFYFRYNVISNKSDIHILEPYLISKYKPIYNKEFVEDDAPSIEIKEPLILSAYNHIAYRR